ncbi:MAG TPA: hypothetical protein PK157_20850 [Bryobacteraceae bacterium]|nr:hypothetical protein [Bryobacteraceae bacterium]
MSNLFGKHANPLLVETDFGGTRFAAEIFPTVKGVVFFDIGWHMNDSGHPFHLIEGKITGEGPWRVGKTVIREITEDDPYALWQEWWDWQAASKKNYPSREEIEEVAREFGALV